MTRKQSNSYGRVVEMSVRVARTRVTDISNDPEEKERLRGSKASAQEYFTGFRVPGFLKGVVGFFGFLGFKKLAMSFTKT
jgi:hypothetical protein